MLDGTVSVVLTRTTAMALGRATIYGGDVISR